MSTHSASSVTTGPMPSSIESMGQNIALIFAAAKETGQSEAVVREALALLQHAAVPGQTDLSSHEDKQPAD